MVVGSSPVAVNYFSGWELYLAYVYFSHLFQAGYAYKRYAYKKNMYPSAGETKWNAAISVKCKQQCNNPNNPKTQNAVESSKDTRNGETETLEPKAQDKF